MVRNIIISIVVIIAIGFCQAAYKAGGEVRLSPRILNYQGYLTDTLGNPITNSSISMIFTIYDAVSAGNQKWTETQGSVSVDKGIFHVLLGNVTPIPDSVFNNTDRWLELSVGGQTLAPRTRIVSAPYAYTATYSDTAQYSRVSAPDNDWTYLISDGADTTLQMGGRWGLARPGNVLFGTADSTHVNFGVACTTGTTGQNNRYCTVSGGLYNTAKGTIATVSGGRSNKANGQSASVAGGWGNRANGGGATVGGGTSNIADSSAATVCGGAYNNGSGDYAFIGGGYGNYITATYAAICGGRSNQCSGSYTTVGGGYDNTADTTYATVCGGRLNLASGYSATVNGGYADTARGDYSVIGGGHLNTTGYIYATVSGGQSNDASSNYSTVGGGWNNTASYYCSTVGGGRNNTTNGFYATIAGGIDDSASADYSFAANNNSTANYANSSAFNGQTTTASGQTRVGALSKASGTFTIDHPLDPENKILNHYFVESPGMSNIYEGEAVLDGSGRAEITLPSYFDALNKTPRIQLTGVGSPDVYVAEKIKGNRFVIGGKPGTEVYWMVTGSRKDPSAEVTRIIMPVEQVKEGGLAGRSLDDEFLVSTMAQLEHMGQAGLFKFRHASEQNRYEEMKRMMRENK